MHDRELGLLGGQDVVGVQPPERPDQRAVLQQPAGLAPVRGHQVVVLAAQGVDRRTGLGDHLRVRAQVRGRPVQRLDQRPHQRGGALQLDVTATGRRALPGLGQLPGIDDQLDDDLPRDGRQPGAPCRRAGDHGRLVRRVGQRLGSVHPHAPAYDGTLDVVVERRPAPDLGRQQVEVVGQHLQQVTGQVGEGTHRRRAAPGREGRPAPGRSRRAGRGPATPAPPGGCPPRAARHPAPARATARGPPRPSGPGRTRLPPR